MSQVVTLFELVRDFRECDSRFVPISHMGIVIDRVIIKTLCGRCSRSHEFEPYVLLGQRKVVYVCCVLMNFVRKIMPLCQKYTDDYTGKQSFTTQTDPIQKLEKEQGDNDHSQQHTDFSKRGKHYLHDP